MANTNEKNDICAVYKKNENSSSGEFDYEGLCIIDHTTGQIIKSIIPDETYDISKENAKIIPKGGTINTNIIESAVANKSLDIPATAKENKYFLYQIPYDNELLKEYIGNKIPKDVSNNEVLKKIFIELDTLLYGSRFSSNSFDFSREAREDSDFELNETIVDHLPQSLIKTYAKFFNSAEKVEKALGDKKTAIKENKNSEKTQAKGNKVDYATVDVNKVISEVKESIIGQDQAVEGIANAIIWNQKMLDNEDKNLFSSTKDTILLDGPTGTGKTAIIESLSNKFGVGFAQVDAMAFSPTGYEGDSLSKILTNLVLDCDGDVEKAQRSVIAIDEFDKLADEKGSQENKIHADMQNELLNFIGGKIYDLDINGKHVKFDTHNLTFICMGAFTRLRDKKAAAGEDVTNMELTTEDLTNYGLNQELVGRLITKVSTKALSKEDLKNILVNSKISALNSFITALETSFGKKVDKSNYNEVVDAIVDRAYDYNTGARALKEVVNQLKLKMYSQINDPNVTTITLDPSLIKKEEFSRGL